MDFRNNFRSRGFIFSGFFSFEFQYNHHPQFDHVCSNNPPNLPPQTFTPIFTTRQDACNIYDLDLILEVMKKETEAVDIEDSELGMGFGDSGADHLQAFGGNRTSWDVELTDMLHSIHKLSRMSVELIQRFVNFHLGYTGKKYKSFLYS